MGTIMLYCMGDFKEEYLEFRFAANWFHLDDLDTQLVKKPYLTISGFIVFPKP